MDDLKIQPNYPTPNPIDRVEPSGQSDEKRNSKKEKRTSKKQKKESAEIEDKVTIAGKEIVKGQADRSKKDKDKGQKIDIRI
ncbi:MAG: hypothetical protein D6813_03365 [Calditrichaeota bacterium]|nr:MAG: hypothetical protein D6813_03365 [Calditrichota bacterium]